MSSIDLVAHEVRVEREAQARHFESLDGKAGLVLGFAGALVALAGRPETLPQGLGLGSGALAALFALWAIFPRKAPVLELGLLRDRYLTADTTFTRVHLIDTHISMARELSKLLGRKAWRLKFATSWLAAAVVLLAIAELVR